jgi:hypothetical protein
MVVFCGNKRYKKVNGNVENNKKTNITWSTGNPIFVTPKCIALS